MKKGMFFIAALSVLVLLPNWLRNESIRPVSRTDRGASKRSSGVVDLADVPVSKTGVTIVLDLNGVLLDIDTKKALEEMGPTNIAQYMVKNAVSPLQVKHELLKKVYTIFNAIQKTGNTMNAHDPYGNRMPGLMCDWQRGLKTNAEVAQLVLHAIQHNSGWFSTEIEKKMVEQVIKKMLTPELLVSAITLVPEGLEYVKKCKQLGYRVMALSNWDAESFGLLLKKFPELFNLFDGVGVSGLTHAIKPDPKAYASLVTRKNKYHEIVIFIDDQEENVKAAKLVGLQAILYKPAAWLLGFGTSPNFTGIEEQVTRIIAQQRYFVKRATKQFSC
jgi:FMN phosphatase YigB (HAD superfamily)